MPLNKIEICVMRSELKMQIMVALITAATSIIVAVIGAVWVSLIMRLLYI